MSDTSVISEASDSAKITFVSSNQKKIDEAQMILGSNFPWRLEILNVDLVEPQATPIEVSRAKCKQVDSDTVFATQCFMSLQ